MDSLYQLPVIVQIILSPLQLHRSIQLNRSVTGFCSTVTISSSGQIIISLFIVVILPLHMIYKSIYSYIQYQRKAVNLLYTLVPYSHHTASSQFSFRRLSYDCLSKIPHNLHLPVFRVIYHFKKSIQKTLVLDSFTKHNSTQLSLAFVQPDQQIMAGFCQF